MLSEKEEAMSLAYEAGHILLENGAEISRVEDTMERIASYYGVENSSFFVLSNGIIATGEKYSLAKFIPIKGTSLDKIVAINQLSRDVEQGKYSLSELKKQLQNIKSMKPKPFWEQILASALGSGAFCIIFGGSFSDSFVSFIVGFLLWIFMLFVSMPRLSRIISNIFGGFLASALCIFFYKIGLGEHLNNMIIGAIIPLIPGVPFTNGIRDIANEDYIAGMTRLLDALLVFFCIALGVAIAFIVDARLFGDMLQLQSLQFDEQSTHLHVQLLAAFIGTAAFAILFGVPRRYYVDCGVCGLLGWLLYFPLCQNGYLSVVEIVFLSTILVALAARLLAILKKCPITVFLICGIFPLVPGAGIFWTSYYLVANQLSEALQFGFLALKITIAIAFGILIVNELNFKSIKNRKFKQRKS